MKKIIFVLMIPILLLLMGCPVGLDYPAEVMGKNPIDSRLLGKWETDTEDMEFTKIELKDNGNNTYEIQVLERGSMYALETDHLTGWIAKIGDLTILVAQPDNEQKYYHYVINFDSNGSLILADVSLLVGGVDGVTSTEALQKEILESSKMEDFAKEKNTFYKEQ